MMRTRPKGGSQQWVIVAIPAAVIVVLVATALLIIAVRPAKKEARVPPAPPENPPAQREVEPTPPAPSPAETTPPPPAPVAGNVLLPTPNVVSPAPSSAPTELAATRPTPGASTAPPRDLLAALNLPADAVAGDWHIEGGLLKCSDASTKVHGKLRLAVPPQGEYDFAVTFTVQDVPYFGQVLSFRGRQFTWMMFARDSAFAMVQGKYAHANPTTVAKGITPGVKHTSIVKVRNDSVSAYVDGEMISSYATDYSDLSLVSAWNLGPSKPLGLAAECPVTVEAITLTPVEGSAAASPAPVPAPAKPLSGYKELAASISSPFSNESSAAAKSGPRPSDDDLQKIVATSQPVISDVAADLRQKIAGPSAATQPATDADSLFRAVHLAISAPLVPDPLREAPPRDASAPDISRADFDFEQARVAAWQKLIAEMTRLYPTAKSQNNVIKLQLTLPDAKRKDASFFAINSTSVPLTNATLSIELVHALSSPSLTARQYYFVPNWPAGQKVYFPAVCVPNVSSPELLDLAGPSIPPTADGIIEARSQLWSDQLAQSLQATKLDAKVEAIARGQLNEGYRVVDDALRRPPASGPSATPRAAIVPGPIIPVRTDIAEAAVAAAQSSARRALALLPPQSPLVTDAKELLAHPQPALRDLRKRQLDNFINALPPQKARSGVWMVRTAAGLRTLASPAGRQAIADHPRESAGKMNLTIDSRTRDGGEIAATLTAPDQPTVRHKLTGRLVVDSSNNRLLLQLRAAQSPPTTRRARFPADLKLATTWSSLLLDLRDDELLGLATCGSGDSAYTLNVAFDPPAAK